MKPGSYSVGQRNGIKYKQVWNRMCDMGSYDSKKRRWFLSVLVSGEWEYIGDFESVKQVNHYLDTR